MICSHSPGCLDTENPADALLDGFASVGRPVNLADLTGAEPISTMLDTSGVNEYNAQTQREQSEGTAVSENDRANGS
jgi:hypothetical protein